MALSEKGKEIIKTIKKELDKVDKQVKKIKKNS